MRFDKAFEVYELLNATPEEIAKTEYEIESYEMAIKILRWKIEDEKDESAREKLKEKLRACIGRGAKLYYPWLEICEKMAKDIASGKVKRIKFDSVRDVLQYYRNCVINDTPDLWRKNCGRLYRGSDHNYLQM